MAVDQSNSTLRFVKKQVHVDAKKPLQGADWTPNTDVYATSEGLVVKVELAGMRRDDLELTMEGNRLRIAGSRPDGCRSPHCKFILMEINYGAFESVIELPDGYDLTRAVASYQNGFLRVDVPFR